MRAIIVKPIAAITLCLGMVFPDFGLQRPAASVQSQQRGPLSPDEELQHLTEALKLSGEQQARLKPVLVSRRAQLTNIRGDRNLSAEGKSSKMKALDEDANGKVMAILNTDQKTKYESMVQHRKEQIVQQRSHGTREHQP